MQVGTIFPGSAYKLSGGTYGQDAIVTPTFEDSLMRVDAVICTPATDAEGEVILPSGVRLNRYVLNPVVLWDHGMGAIPFPVGKSVHPDGTLAILKADDAIEASCYFTQAFPEGPQLYQLLKEGTLRAASIHVLPDMRHNAVDANGAPVKVIADSEMLEWSWGCIGCNPEAVAKTLAAGRLNGEPIVPAIKSMLTRFAPVRRVQGIGANFGASGMTTDAAKTIPPAGAGATALKTLADPSTLTDDELAAAMGNIGEYDDATQTALRAEAGKREAAKTAAAPAADAAKTSGEELQDEAAKTGEPAAAKNGDMGAEIAADAAASDVPLGAQVVASLYDSVNSFIAMAEQALGPVENVPVKEAITAELDAFKASLATLEGLYASQYPDLPGLTGNGEGEEEESPEVEAVKTWLRSSIRNEFQFGGIAAQLGVLTTAKNLTPTQVKKLSAAKTFLDGLSNRAKAQQQQQVDGQGAANEERIKSLESKMDRLLTTFSDMLPARR